MRRGLFLFTLMFFLSIPLSYAQELRDPSPDGMYKVDDVIFKFIPPKGWKMSDTTGTPSSAMPIAFMETPLSGSVVSVSVRPSPLLDGAAGARLLNGMQEAFKTDQTLSEKQIVEFKGVKAFVSVSDLGGAKTKQIQFFKAGNWVILSFVALEADDFARLLPSVDESFKTFDIVPTGGNSLESLAPAGQDSLSPSEKVSKLFQEVAYKVSLGCLKEAQKRNLEPELNGMDEKSLQEGARQGSADLMTRFKDAFVVSDSEARKMLQGKYDDAGNMKTIRESLDRFNAMSFVIPLPIQYLVEEYSNSFKGEPFSSLDAEFTARLFKEYLKQKRAVRLLPAAINEGTK